MSALHREPIFDDVVISLKSVLDEEQFDVLYSELAAFSEEYRHAHYTACALRVGRTLEHVVYALARAWNVSVNRLTLDALSTLDQSFELLSRSVIEYAASSDSQRQSKRKAVQTHCATVSQRLVSLVFQLDSDVAPVKTSVPINVESIVMDIKKQFTAHRDIRDSIDTLINENVIRKILNVRNDAAHADTTGERRELSRTEIDETVELLRRAIFLFGNVAFAVAQRT